jgi:cytochrome P450
MENTEAVVAWASQCCTRESLAPGSLGMAMYEAADRGEVTPQEANLLVGILLSAAADTTVLTLANTIRAFCEFPDQYRLVRSDRALIRAAFEESLRWDSPSRMAGRIAMKEVEIDGYVVPAGERCGLMFAAANRDPRRWETPDRFDVRRNNRDNLGFGYGVHACVGRVLALLEAEALLGALAESIELFQPAGEPEPWMTTIGHGPIRLPVGMEFAAH